MSIQSSEVPLHAVIRAHLLEQIEQGQLRPGDQIPTEPELISTFDVSRTTVRRALRDLETMGLILRQPGRGSFVREPQLEPRLDRLTGFVEDMAALGLTATARVVTIERIPASPVVADRLRLQPRDTVVHIERVRLANGQPISFDDSYFREDLGTRVSAENLENEPFYSILEEKYGLPLSQAEYVLAAALADARTADFLMLGEGAPVLVIERTSYTKDDPRPVLFEYLHNRGDRMRYRLRLDR